MKNLFKLLVFGAIAFGGYTAYDRFLGNNSHALDGNWRSNKEASVEELARNGASQGTQARLARVFGRMVYEINDGVWKAKIDGKEMVDTFEVLSRTGDCYSLKTGDGIQEVCLRDHRLYVRSEVSGAYEVFDRL